MSRLKTRIAAPAVVAIGSNLGDRAATLHSAVAELAAADGVEVRAISPLIETVAVRPDGADPTAPPYLNGVVLLTTTLTPDVLLDLLLSIEQRNGRVRTERWGDRTLDLDLIDVAGLTRETARLTLPHPRAHERDFVLRPWLAVDPDATLPGHGSVATLLAGLEAAGRPSTGVG